MSAPAVQQTRASRYEQRTLWLRRMSWLFLILALLNWAVSGILYYGTWSLFTTSAIRERVPRPGENPPPLPGKTTIQERDEVHYMAGEGGLFIGGHTVRSNSFAKITSDAISRSLAWSGIEDGFPPWFIWRYYRNGPNIIIGIRFLPLAILSTLLWGMSIVIRRRQVPLGHCRRCRYDMVGSSNTPPTTMICPECGTRTI